VPGSVALPSSSRTPVGRVEQMTKTDDSELVRAAAHLEQVLRKLEELSQAVCKMRLHNERSITRAAQELNLALEQPARLAEGLKLLADAMGRLQARQEAALTPLAARAQEIQSRAARLTEYGERFAALGAQAAETSKVLQTAQGEGGVSEGAPGAVLEDVDQRLTAIMNGARGLADSARAEDLPDFARDADALKQRVQALRARLKGALN
jgi:chromosome segregation ATPase